MTETGQEYWEDYDGLQAAKHKILKEYLGGWFPILGFSNKRILYIDTHAGRGRHSTGAPGSPLIAIETLLSHRSRDSILYKTEALFYFLEIDEENSNELKKEINGIKRRCPNGIKINNPITNDWSCEIENILKNVDLNSIPAFIFIDPFGFKIPMRIINQLLKFPKCEVFINFMHRYIDMAIKNEHQVDNLNALFGSIDWIRFRNVNDSVQRRKEMINFYAKQLNAKFITKIQMFGKNNVLKYVLFHCTNHSKGWWLMKDTIWKAIPNGSFCAFEKNRPEQLILLTENPDLSPLKNMVVTLLKEKPYKCSEIKDIMEEKRSLFRETHLHSVLQELHKEHKIITDDSSNKLKFSKNPLIKFV